ncbi:MULTISPECIES: potassium channel family protein [Micrococcaceae]|uniref:potassium channel family protein n=1 Tax=unclassified Kocuria TaxID=2649579 RepID=UPI00101326B9|nr:MULTISPECIES: TrkA family potassium uptake protein [unclassified Kocuria]
MADRSPHNAPVLVIGLGRFGAATAQQLRRQNKEVLAIERDPDMVQRWSGLLTHVIQADASDIDALRQVGAGDFTSAVVGVGTSIESSVLITANLVDLGIERIWAKAITPAHGKILSRIGAHYVIFPEADAGRRTAHLVSGRLLDYIEFDDDFAIVKMYPPKETHGFTLQESDVRNRYGVTIVGVKSPGEEFTYATARTKVTSRDVLIVSGQVDLIERFAARP